MTYTSTHFYSSIQFLCMDTMEDQMYKFTQCVNTYDLSGYETPSVLFDKIGDDFSSLVYKHEDDVTIDTIVYDDMSRGMYPLLGNNCLSRKMPNIHEHIGEGTTGHVYSMVGKHGPVAVKFQEHSSGSPCSFTPGNGNMNVMMNEFKLEVDFQLHMSSLGISPCVYNSWTSNYSCIWGSGNQDVLIMDRLKETIFEKTSREKEYTNGVMELISKMHDNNVFHGDMHSGNIMVDWKNVPLMIDFGRSKKMPQGDQERTWCMMHDYVLLYTTISRKSDLKPILKNKILELAPDRTILGTTFDLCE